MFTGTRRRYHSWRGRVNQGNAKLMRGFAKELPRAARKFAKKAKYHQRAARQLGWRNHEIPVGGGRAGK